MRRSLAPTIAILLLLFATLSAFAGAGDMLRQHPDGYCSATGETTNRPLGWDEGKKLLFMDQSVTDVIKAKGGTCFALMPGTTDFVVDSAIGNVYVDGNPVGGSSFPRSPFSGRGSQVQLDYIGGSSSNGFVLTVQAYLTPTPSSTTGNVAPTNTPVPAVPTPTWTSGPYTDPSGSCRLNGESQLRTLPWFGAPSFRMAMPQDLKDAFATGRGGTCWVSFSVVTTFVLNSTEGNVTLDEQAQLAPPRSGLLTLTGRNLVVHYPGTVADGFDLVVNSPRVTPTNTPTGTLQPTQSPTNTGTAVPSSTNTPVPGVPTATATQGPTGVTEPTGNCQLNGESGLRPVPWFSSASRMAMPSDLANEFSKARGGTCWVVFPNEVTFELNSTEGIVLLDDVTQAAPPRSEKLPLTGTRLEIRYQPPTIADGFDLVVLSGLPTATPTSVNPTATATAPAGDTFRLFIPISQKNRWFVNLPSERKQADQPFSGECFANGQVYELPYDFSKRLLYVPDELKRINQSAEVQCWAKAFGRGTLQLNGQTRVTLPGESIRPEFPPGAGSFGFTIQEE